MNNKESESSYTQALGLWVQGVQVISNNDLKPLWQMFSIDSNINFPSDNDFLYQFFGNYNLKMSKLMIFYIYFQQLWLENEQNLCFP